MRDAEIGAEFGRLKQDVKDQMISLLGEYRSFAIVGSDRPALLKRAVDSPHRARAQITAWIAGYNARHGAGTAQAFVQRCFTAAGSSETLASTDAAVATLETQCATLVAHVRDDGWTWDQVATAIEAQFAAQPESDFDYKRLPIPANYQTVWGEPY